MSATSEIAFSAYHSVQVDAAVWCYDPGFGCQMGVQSFVVFLELVWTAVGLWVYLG